MNTYNDCNCGCLQSNKDNLYKDVNKIGQKATAPKKKKNEKQMFKTNNNKKKAPPGFHYMPNGKLMKNSDMKKKNKSKSSY